MKICFQIIAFNSDYFLEPVLKSILPFGPVVAAEGPVGYWQQRGYATSTDRTSEILHAYLPVSNITHGCWPEKNEMVSAALALVPPDTTHLFAVDADEVWKADDLRRVFALLDRYDSMSFRFQSFYGGFEQTMRGFEYNFENVRIQRFYPGCRWHTHRPPTILAPDGKPWREHRHMNQVETGQLGLFIYHYSYVFPSQMKAKAEYYHSRGGTIANYMNRVYLPWVLGDDEAKQRIEGEFDGVHDWLPERRGPCRTRAFKGEHPVTIRAVLPELKARFEKELEAYR